MTLGDTLGNAQALAVTLADTVQETKELSVGDTRIGAKALVDAWADKIAVLEAVTPGDTLGDAHAHNDLLGDSWQNTRQCAGTGRHVD